MNKNLFFHQITEYVVYYFDFEQKGIFISTIVQEVQKHVNNEVDSQVRFEMEYLLEHFIIYVSSLDVEVLSHLHSKVINDHLEVTGIFLSISLDVQFTI